MESLLRAPTTRNASAPRNARSARSETCITVCPCSNHRLQVNRRFFGGENPTRQLLTKGLKVTLNSDDPAYFFGHTDKYGTTHGSS